MSRASLLTIDDDCMRTIADFLGRLCCSLMRVCQSCWSILRDYALHINLGNINNLLHPNLNLNKVRYIRLQISTVRMLKNVLDVTNLSKLFKRDQCMFSCLTHMHRGLYWLVRQCSNESLCFPTLVSFLCMLRGEQSRLLYFALHDITSLFVHGRWAETDGDTARLTKVRNKVRGRVTLLCDSLVSQVSRDQVPMFFVFGGGVLRFVLRNNEITGIVNQHWPNYRAILSSLVQACTTDVENDILGATRMGDVPRRFAHNLRRMHQLMYAFGPPNRESVTASQWDKLGCLQKLHSIKVIKHVHSVTADA